MNILGHNQQKRWHLLSSLSWMQKSLLFLAIAIYVFNFFPTHLELDSQSMYHDALNLRYVDYWPPLTLLLWHYLSWIREGGDLMLALNLVCLWSACIIGLYLFRREKISYFFLLIPFVPSIFLDAGRVLKDTIFSFGYMLLAMILAYHTLKEKRLSLWKTVCLLLGVFYFSMVKIQAQYIFPLMVLWIVLLQPPLRLKIPAVYWKGILWAVLSVGIFGGMKACNNALVQQQNNAHFWQYVKIYDLAGMSVFANKMYVPDFLLKNDSITVKDIETHYDYLWEPLIRYDHSPLIATQSDEEREALITVWKESIIQDPVSYLKHRFRLWFKILGASALKGEYVKWAGDSPALLKIAPVFSLFSMLPLLPLYLYFWWLGVRNLGVRKEGVPLFMFSSMGLTLLFVLFVFSLAAAGRYIYFSWCCFMFSVPFAWRCYTQNNATSN